MRIFAGSARGRFIKTHPEAVLRPTTDRVRLAVFNAVGALVPGCRFLDLFCGSGSMGLEALSRGAQRSMFVDSQRVCVESAEISARAFGFSSGSWSATCADYRRALASLAARGEQADLVYLDPPYDAGLGPDALKLLLSLNLLALHKDTRVLYEHSADQKSPIVEGLALYRRYDHGAASISVYGPPLEASSDLQET